MHKGQTVGGMDGGMSVFEIAEVLGCSHQRASFLVAKAMAAFKRELLRRGYDGDSFLERICKRDSEDSEKSLQK